MEQTEDEARKSLLIDVMSKDIPMVMASLYGSGKIDPDFLNVISQYLGSVVSEADTTETVTPVNN